MYTKTISVDAVIKLSNAFVRDKENFELFDEPNLNYYELPTFELNQEIRRLSDMRNSIKTQRNISILIKDITNDLKKIPEITNRDLQGYEYITEISAKYHVLRMKLDILFEHLKGFNNTENNDELKNLLNLMKVWYNAELNKVTPDDDSSSIINKTAVCLIKKLNRFAIALKEIKPELHQELKEMSETLGTRFVDFK